MVASVVSTRVSIEKWCDYIPVVSTVTNLTALFHKAVFLEPMKKAGFDKNPFYTSLHEIPHHSYYKYLEDKETWECVALLIPVLGNVFVAITRYLSRKQDDPQAMLNAIIASPDNMHHISRRLCNDRQFILSVVDAKIPAEKLDAETRFQYMKRCSLLPEHWKWDPEVAAHAMKSAGGVRELFAVALWRDPQWTLDRLEDMVPIDVAILFSDKHFQALYGDHKDVIRVGAKKGIDFTPLLSDQLKKDEAFMLELDRLIPSDASLNPLVHLFANDADMMSSLIVAQSEKKNVVRYLSLLSPQLQDSSAFWESLVCKAKDVEQINSWSRFALRLECSWAERLLDAIYKRDPGLIKGVELSPGLQKRYPLSMPPSLLERMGLKRLYQGCVSAFSKDALKG